MEHLFFSRTSEVEVFVGGFFIKKNHISGNRKMADFSRFASGCAPWRRRSSFLSCYRVGGITFIRITDFATP